MGPSLGSSSTGGPVSDFSIPRLIGSLPDLEDDALDHLREAVNAEGTRRNQAKRKPRVHRAHWQESGYGPVPKCGAYSRRTTEDPRKVTCRRCTRGR